MTFDTIDPNTKVITHIRIHIHKIVNTNIFRKVWILE